MAASRKHIVWVLSNASTAPYFNWFAQLAAVKKDFDMSFVCLYRESPGMIEDMKKLGFPCYWIRYDWHFRKSGMFRSYFQLYKLFRKIKPDIVHTHLFDDSLTAITAAQLAGIKRRIVTKGDASYHYYHTPAWVRFDRLINKKATDILALSNESRDFILEKEKADPKKVELLHHGLNIKAVTAVNEEYENQFRERWSLKEKTVVGTVSRFIDWKGYDDIIEVIRLVIKTRQNIVFLFCGEGETKPKIIDKIKEYGLEDYVLMTGRLLPQEIPSLYGVMDIFLHAARNEPFGLVIPEAMLNGVPVVSTPSGAAKDAVISGEHGYLCAYGNHQEMADAIIKLTNKDAAQKMGQRCIARATKLFSSEIMYANQLKIYLSK